MAWHAKATGGYARTSTEAIENAGLLASALYNIGWCKKSVCALLGNGAGESGLNPWRWQGDYIASSTELATWTIEQLKQHGYGIFQFTPPTKYINSTNEVVYQPDGYSPNLSDSPGTAQDGNAQTVFFQDNVSQDWRPVDLYGYYYDNFSNIGIDISSWYYTNYQKFIAGTDNNNDDLTLYELVGVFELNYERPRDDYAASSYQYRCDNADYWMGVIPDPGPQPGTIPIWLLFKFNDWRFK